MEMTPEEKLDSRKDLVALLTAVQLISKPNQDIVISGPSIISGLILGLMHKDLELIANLLTSANALGVTVDDIAFLITAGPNEDDTRLWNIILKFKPLT